MKEGKPVEEEIRSEYTQEQIDEIERTRLLSDAEFLQPEKSILVPGTKEITAFDVVGVTTSVGGATFENGTLVDIAPYQIEQARHEMDEAHGVSPEQLELTKEEYDHYKEIEASIKEQGIVEGQRILVIQRRDGIIGRFIKEKEIVSRFLDFDARVLKLRDSARDNTNTSVPEYVNVPTQAIIKIIGGKDTRFYK